jgi:hypothetical protein
MKQTLVKQIEALRDMTVTELREAYQRVFGEAVLRENSIRLDGLTRESWDKLNLGSRRAVIACLRRSQRRVRADWNGPQRAGA